MLFFIYLSLCAWFLTNYLSAASIVPWANPALELLDELHDAEIYKAVVSSMNEWQRKQDLKRINNRIKRQDTSVCYPELGCFDASGPFGYLDMLPSKPEEIDTKFLLYPGHSRRRSGSPPAEIPFGNLQEAFEWAKQGFNKTLPTKVLIHGFGSGCTHIWVYEMRSALMAVEEINVICVDWENGAILPNYVKATANTRLVGKQLAMLLRGLVEHNGLSLKNTHLIGFSLGAHVAGFAGAEMGNLSRITGLDPAGPLFESQDPRARLDQTDADFVDVIHSNGENLILGGLGSYQPMGHVDFYPNGGRMQKGCSNLFVGAVSDIIWSSAVEGRSLCNHRRAYKFFTDSVSPRCHFPAFPCGSYEDFLAGKCFPCTEERKCGNMGYYADRSKGRGQLYLITRDEEPFCAHQYHVKIETSPSNVHIVSYGKIQITLIGDSTLNETFMMTRKEDEEMTLGQSISRILVPHPILAEPTRIQILYSAYSGWLSSGLTQWRIEKVTLSDSFGKTSSVCKKNLVLESGIPVNLPLYPGECNLPSDVLKEAQDRVHELNKNITSNSLDNGKFKPTPVVKIGNEDIKNDLKQNKSSLSFRDAIEILNIPWSNDKENNIIDSEAESSRAFNTRVIKASEFNQNLKDADGLVREIVEPILKPHSNKNARSHNLDRAKPEITEPILGPTTSKNSVGYKTEPLIRNDFFSKLNKDQKELTYNFYENDEWAASPAKETPNDKYKREEKFQVVTSLDDLKSPENPLDVIVTTVQFLPQRLARMFEEAEKYARETILPLVSTYTPKFITDIIAPKPQSKYVPLMFPGDPKKSTNRSIESRSATNKTLPQTSGQNVNNNKPQVPSPTYTHIQKIRKKNDNIEFVLTETKSPDSEKVLPKDTNELEVSRKARDDAHAKENVPKTPNIDKTTADSVFSFRKFVESVTQSSPKNVQNKENVTKKNPEAIYIDLPVFEEEKSIKYIPLSYSGSKN